MLLVGTLLLFYAKEATADYYNDTTGDGIDVGLTAGLTVGFCVVVIAVIVVTVYCCRRRAAQTGKVVGTGGGPGNVPVHSGTGMAVYSVDAQRKGTVYTGRHGAANVQAFHGQAVQSPMQYTPPAVIAPQSQPILGYSQPIVGQPHPIVGRSRPMVGRPKQKNVMGKIGRSLVREMSSEIASGAMEGFTNGFMEESYSY